MEKWYIYLHENHTNQLNLGKYTSPMDRMVLWEMSVFWFLGCILGGQVAVFTCLVAFAGVIKLTFGGDQTMQFW